MDPNSSTANREFERRLRRLALRDGMTFATFAALGGQDRAVLLATIVRRFEPERAYTERQVNEQLKAWLEGVGGMIETDHVNLRRLLIDRGVMTRTSDCAEYRLAADGAVDQVHDPAGLDVEAVVADARRAAREQRAARKAEWQQRRPAGQQGEQGQRPGDRADPAADRHGSAR